MTQEERINKATALIATAEKRLAEAQAELEEARKEPKPKLIGAPLRVSPNKGVEYWYLNARNKVEWVTRGEGLFDSALLDAGNVFATKEDAEFAAKKRKIFAHPIGEWDPESRGWYWNWCRTLIETILPAKSYPEAYRLWLDGELAFGDDGKVELERRAAAWKALCKEYGVA